MKVLITGGNGFIGSHLAGALCRKKIPTRILCRTERFKFTGCLPANWKDSAEIVRGDINDFELVQNLIDGIDVIFHKVASVGIVASGQNSRQYVQTNIGGTASLIDALRQGNHKVQRIVLDSSAGVYGEGLYNCARCHHVRPQLRYFVQVALSEEKRWEPPCPKCGGTIQPLATSEEAERLADSVYAITKKSQEDLLAGFCHRSGISLNIMRYSTVYGPGQSEANYCAELMRQLAVGRQPDLTEDGRQTRDFVWIDDVVASNLALLSYAREGVLSFNIASGQQTSMIDFVHKVSQAVSQTIGRKVPPPLLTGRFNPGDVRHCITSIELAGKELSYRPRTSLDEGVERLARLRVESEPDLTTQSC